MSKSIQLGNSNDSPLVESYDERCDVQARLWNQFVRNGITNQHILKRVDKDADYKGAMIVTPDAIKSTVSQSQRSAASNRK